MATGLSLTLTLTLTLLFLSMVVDLNRGFFMGNKVGHLRVAAFNVKSFGRTYVKEKSKALKGLVTILARYDIVLLQEARDSTHESLDVLKEKLEDKTDESWKYIDSQELGSHAAYMEQYVFFYREKSASVVSSYQVNITDNGKKIYAREPFCVEFAFISSSQKHSQAAIHRENVVFLAIHTRPTTTIDEMKELPNTIRSVGEMYPHAAGIIAMGDMNADCRYLAGKWRKSLEIFNHEDFKSVIGHDADTTVRESTECAYDRVILYGKRLEVKRAKVFKFSTSLDLNETEALKISDHFPVEFSLY